MTAFKAYLLSVSATVLFCAVCDVLIPNEKINKTGQFISALLLVLAVLSPVLKLDETNIKQAVQELERMVSMPDVSAFHTDDFGLEQNITRNCEAYISDKAEELGVELEIEVRLTSDGAVPYPESAVITGTYTPAERSMIEEIIAEDLGIPPEKQEWSMH